MWWRVGGKSELWVVDEWNGMEWNGMEWEGCVMVRM